MCDFVISLVAIRQSQVVILNLEVHKWENELRRQEYIVLTNRSCDQIELTHACKQML